MGATSGGHGSPWRDLRRLLLVILLAVAALIPTCDAGAAAPAGPPPPPRPVAHALPSRCGTAATSGRPVLTARQSRPTAAVAARPCRCCDDQTASVTPAVVVPAGGPSYAGHPAPAALHAPTAAALLAGRWRAAARPAGPMALSELALLRI